MPAYWIENNISQWEAAFNALPSHLKEPFGMHQYCRLYTHETAHAHCFLYQEQKEIFLLPFIQEAITAEPGYFDLVSAYGYGGPLSSTNDSEFTSLAYQHFVELASEHKIVASLTKFNPLLKNHSLKGFPGDLHPMCPVAISDTTVNSDERLTKVYSHANRKNIKKAQRNGVSITIGKDQSLWKDFVNLYTATMDRNNSTDFYYFTESYFSQIATNLGDNFVIANATLENRTIASLLVLTSVNNAYCHLIGSNQESLKLGANNLLHHELIEWCGKNGIKSLMIGGGRSNADDDPLLKFKKNFTDHLETLQVGEHIINKDLYQKIKSDYEAENGKLDTPHKLLFYR